MPARPPPHFTSLPISDLSKSILEYLYIPPSHVYKPHAWPRQREANLVPHFLLFRPRVPFSLRPPRLVTIRARVPRVIFPTFDFFVRPSCFRIRSHPRPRLRFSVRFRPRTQALAPASPTTTHSCAPPPSSSLVSTLRLGTARPLLLRPRVLISGSRRVRQRLTRACLHLRPPWSRLSV